MIKREIKYKPFSKKIDDDTVQFNLISLDVLSKISMQILYYKEHGIKNFNIIYNPDALNCKIDKTLLKLNLLNIFKLARTYNLKINFKGFPRCIYESKILKPTLKWYFGKHVFFINSKSTNTVNSPYCKYCLKNEDCLGINNDYVEKYGFEEFKPLVSNEKLFNLNFEKINSLKNSELKEIGNFLLKDFKKDKDYLRKRFIFSKTFSENLDNNQDENFSYYMDNKKRDFENTYELLATFFEKELLDSIKNFLEISNHIVLTFNLTSKGDVKKSFYFLINDLKQSDLIDLENRFNLKFEENIWGFGFDYCNTNSCYSLFYDYRKLSSEKIKDYFKDINFENKKLLLKYLNSLTKPLNQVLFINKINDGEIFSKQVEMSMQHNVCNLSSLAILFGLNLNCFKDCEILSINFETSNVCESKISFNYSLNLPLPDLFEEQCD